MDGQPRLGVPENGRGTTMRQAASAFDTYARLLLTYCDEFDADVLSVSTIERFQTRVRDLANQLGDEAAFLRQRSGFHVTDGTRPKDRDLASVEAADPTHATCSFDIHEAIDEVVRP